MPEPMQVANPFELMMNPEAVLQAIARSERLERLHRRVCRPLDKPVIARDEADKGEHDIAATGAVDAETAGGPEQK